jgi:hypothetical protein
VSRVKLRDRRDEGNLTIRFLYFSVSKKPRKCNFLALSMKLSDISTQCFEFFLKKSTRLVFPVKPRERLLSTLAGVFVQSARLEPP